MQKNYRQLVTGVIIGLLIGWLIGKYLPEHSVASKGDLSIPVALPHADQKEGPQATAPAGHDNSIPQKAFDVLRYIRSHNHSMDGYEGGREFSNREKIVPQADGSGRAIQYREWDVNPKIRGQNRGAERILTGSDGRAWYTNDHYQSFTEIK
jgi:ribonuclease T1